MIYRFREECSWVQRLGCFDSNYLHTYQPLSSTGKRFSLCLNQESIITLTQAIKEDPPPPHTHRHIKILQILVCYQLFFLCLLHYIEVPSPPPPIQKQSYAYDKIYLKSVCKFRELMTTFRRYSNSIHYIMLKYLFDECMDFHRISFSSFRLIQWH